MEKDEATAEFLGYKRALRESGVRFKYKRDSWLMKYYAPTFNTTIANTIYFGEGYDEFPNWRKLSVLRHEKRHVDHNRLFGLGSGKLGALILFPFYALLPFPIFFAWFRWLAERDAYMETLRVYRRYAKLLVSRKIVEIADMMTDDSYVWTLHRELFHKYIIRWFNTKMVEEFGMGATINE